MVVREDDRGPDEHTVSQGSGLVDEGVVLDLAAIPDAHTFADVCTPTDDRLYADGCIFSNLGEVPHAGAGGHHRTGRHVGAGLDHGASLSLLLHARVRSQIPSL